jgi:hypothetical protein
MDRPRLFRGLRIAVSAVCLIVCVILIALWVRSFWWRDRLEAPWLKSGLINVWSKQGQLACLRVYSTPGHWRITTSRIHSQAPILAQLKSAWQADGQSSLVYFPHWIPVLVLAALAASPWLPWRFSLRTLLIATTIVAVSLGMIMAIAR